MLRLVPLAVSAAAASAAAALGLFARRGRVPLRLRWCHHALYLVSVVAAAGGAPATWRRRGGGVAVLPLLALAVMPATRAGSRRHVGAGVAVVATLVTVVAVVGEDG